MNRDSFFFFRIAFYSAVLFLISCDNKFDGKNGINTVYYDGTKQIMQVVEMKDGRKNGLCREYYKNGNLRSQAWYSKDTVRDTVFYYFEEGPLSSVQIYNHGKKNGCWKKFSKKGILYSEIWYKDNELNGPS